MRSADSPTPKIACPVCGDLQSKVINTRPSDTGVYRRRECPRGHRFNTEETARPYATQRTKDTRHHNS